MAKLAAVWVGSARLMSYGGAALKATRNPRLSRRSKPGEFQRFVALMPWPPLEFHPPPRLSRTVPFAGPRGSITLPPG